VFHVGHIMLSTNQQCTTIRGEKSITNKNDRRNNAIFQLKNVVLTVRENEAIRQPCKKEEQIKEKDARAAMTDGSVRLESACVGV
jgi:hypothetical protein